MNNEGKTHFADDDTLRYIARLEAELAEAQRDAARYHHLLKLICADNNKALVDMLVQELDAMRELGPWRSWTEEIASLKQLLAEAKRDAARYNKLLYAVAKKTS